MPKPYSFNQVFSSWP